MLTAEVALAAALLVSVSQTPTYTSSTQLFVSTTDQTSTADVYSGSQFSQQRVGSYTQLLSGQKVASRVKQKLGLTMSVTQLQSNIAAAPISGTVLINVQVEDTSPGRAQQIAGAVGSEFAKYVQTLETPAGQATSPVKVTVTEAATRDDKPSSPSYIRNGAIATVLGLLVGVVVAWLQSRLDRSIKRAEDLEALTDVPMLGMVLREEQLARQHLLAASSPSRALEDYRQLRTNLQFLDVDSPPKVILISSALPAEGKSTLSINLALTLAEVGARVTLVDADLRRPKVADYLGIVGDVGLTDVLTGQVQPAEATQSFGESTLRVIPSGQLPPNPGQLLASGHMADLIESLRSTNDFVIIDTAPILPVADTSALAPRSDGVLLSVKYGETQRDNLERALGALEAVGARALGLILNIVPPKADVAAVYGRTYGYDYSGPVRAVQAPPA